MSNRHPKEASVVPEQELPAEGTVGKLEQVHHFNDAMPTGVTVSHQGRIFVNFPKWGDEVSFTVAEIHDGELVAFPNEAINQTDPNDPSAALVSVQWAARQFDMMMR
jgi:sugar lactone lactonase YvrE